MIQVKLYNGCKAFREKIKKNDRSTSTFSFDSEIINEYNGKDVSKNKMTKIQLKNNDWIRFNIKVNMIGCN